MPGREKPVAAACQRLEVELDRQLLRPEVAGVLRGVERVERVEQALEVLPARARDDVHVLRAADVAVRGDRDAADDEKLDVVLGEGSHELERPQDGHGVRRPAATVVRASLRAAASATRSSTVERS